MNDIVRATNRIYDIFDVIVQYGIIVGGGRVTAHVLIY